MINSEIGLRSYDGGHITSMTYTLTIQMPDSESNPSVQWRIEEFVRVLQASAILHNSVSAARYGNPTFAYVPYEVYSVDKPGKRFTRIVRDTGSQKMVVCFVENDTGKVVKAAGWKAPAKDKDGMAYRYDLMDPASRAELYRQGRNATYYKEG